MVATAIGDAISKARSAVAKNVYEGPVTHHTEIHNNSSTTDYGGNDFAVGTWSRHDSQRAQG
ncbi:hypothetical protein AB0C96_14640 [Streptomyces sp. NPDC048506]|uniref:hypothetical protein n=1 Tax=Streptomyces sp. NPDC048506 TaxID=3155028 RepID=UPI00343CFACF